MIDSKKIVVRKKISGEDALLVSEGVDYKIVPEDLDFEPMLARGISEKDFILKGKVVDKSFIATDVVYHGEYLANKSWDERYLELKNGFDYTPSIRFSGAIVLERGDNVEEAVKAFSYSPHFEGVYVEEYNSDIFEGRYELSKEAVQNL